MPRKDRTFSDKDVIRIFNQHLSPSEQSKVLISLCRDVKIEVFDDIAILVPELADLEAIEETDIIDLVVDLLLTGLGR